MGPRSGCSVGTWTCEQVGHWLENEGFSDYVDLLCREHRLDGPGLLSLTEADLCSPPLRLEVLGDIKRLVLAVRRLQRENPAALQELGITSAGGHFGDCQRHGVEQHGRDRRSSGARGHYWAIGVQQWHQLPDSPPGQREGAVRLDPEYWKTALSVVYVLLVFGITSFVMVIVHERVPDMRTYPPLPDIFLDSVPRIPWAFAMAEACGLILCSIWLLVLLLHKYRSILFRRMCSLMGTVFLLRCVTMLITSLSVPGVHLQCSRKVYGDIWAKLWRASTIWLGFGMTLAGVQTCGDYMFSGHTVVLTMLNFLITEYSPRSWYFIHTLSWVLNLFGVFFILAAHEHYSIDVFVAFYLTTRIFLYYHTLANTCAYQHSRRMRIWFPLFSFFECNVGGTIPNVYSWPFSQPQFLRSLIIADRSE